jgi:hypothetical protein
MTRRPTPVAGGRAPGCAARAQEAQGKGRDPHLPSSRWLRELGKIGWSGLRTGVAVGHCRGPRCATQKNVAQRGFCCRKCLGRLGRPLCHATWHSRAPGTAARRQPSPLHSTAIRSIVATEVGKEKQATWVIPVPRGHVCCCRVAEWSWRSPGPCPYLTCDRRPFCHGGREVWQNGPQRLARPGRFGRSRAAGSLGAPRAVRLSPGLTGPAGQAWRRARRARRGRRGR